MVYSDPEQMDKVKRGTKQAFDGQPDVYEPHHDPVAEIATERSLRARDRPRALHRRARLPARSGRRARTPRARAQRLAAAVHRPVAEHSDAFEFIKEMADPHGEGTKTIVRSLLHYRDTVMGSNGHMLAPTSPLPACCPRSAQTGCASTRRTGPRRRASARGARPALGARTCSGRIVHAGQTGLVFKPPLGASIWPTMKLESSQARKRATEAISAGVPIRCAGVPATAAAIASSGR